MKHIDENAANKLKDEMYVDDIVTGDSNSKKVDVLKEDIKEILANGGFFVKGFVKSGDTSKENLALLDTGEVGRVLGIGWNPKHDEFAVKVRINLFKKFKGARRENDLGYQEIMQLTNRKLTRRMLLGITNSCYDPLELRDLYRKTLNLGWDDDISPEKREAWVNLLQLLRKAEMVRFRRCICDINSIGFPELIVFSDGAPDAMRVGVLLSAIDSETSIIM